jgi:hypothetical protein
MNWQKSLLAWAIIGVVACVMVLQLGGAGAAQATGDDPPTAQLQIVSYADGRTAFFDPSTKRLYVYGADLRTSIMVVEVDQLGQPLRLLQRTGR